MLFDNNNNKMKPRSKKYYQRRKENSGEKKGSVSKAGYNEEMKLPPGRRLKKILRLPSLKMICRLTH
jgi:hypothetical protein